MKSIRKLSIFMLISLIAFNSTIGSVKASLPQTVAENQISDNKKDEENEIISIENEEKQNDEEASFSDSQEVESTGEISDSQVSDTDKDVSQLENLGNEPPLLDLQDKKLLRAVGTLDWRSLSEEYWVIVANSEFGNNYEGTWFTIQGQTVFCIEAKIKAYKDQPYEIDATFLSDKQRHDISLITYFAFTTQTQNDRNYAITQYMIWE